MRVTVQIPIKGQSERVPGKNLREVGGKPLFAHLLDRLRDDAPKRWRMVVDTDSDEVQEAVSKRYGDCFEFHRREAWYAGNRANGNHLLIQFAHAHPDTDIYVQAFVTAPLLSFASLFLLVEKLADSDALASATHVVEATGWYWFDGEPVNYEPDMVNGLPRSQDATMWRECTGAYAVRREALLLTGCRLPSPREMVPLDPREAMDVDTLDDFEQLQKELHDEGTSEKAHVR